MQGLAYDGTMDGLLSAVFYCYEYRLGEVKIRPAAFFQHTLFGNTVTVLTEEAKSARVWDGLKNKLSKTGLANFYRAFLSEESGIEDHLLAYCRHAFASKHLIDSDFSHPAVMHVSQLSKKVYREKHRMEAFVRFQLTADNMYYSAIEPDFNVLPLIEPHFKNRYADQRWLIYDVKRKYALYYDLQSVAIVELRFSEGLSNSDIGLVTHENEALYQQLWQRYFKSVNIEARKNLKLHLKEMPRRYWRRMVEKMG